jgi:hypothetical protein
LLEGEDPSTHEREDARHWRDVYSELAAFKEQVLGTVIEFEERTARDASREIARTDRVAMEAELRRFRRRLAFWTDRLARLGKGGASR